MADLSTDCGGIKSPNPFWVASGPPANTAYQVMRAFDAGWGGAVWKTIGEPIVNTSSRYGGVDLGMSRVMGFNNIELISDRPIEDNLREIAEVKKRWPRNAVVASLMVESKREVWHEIVKRTEDTGADGLELNFGCPHGMSERGMGSAVGQVPEYTKLIVSWVKEAATAAGQRDGEGEMTLEAVFARIRSGAVKELNLIVKADVQGSVEPITNSLEKLGDQTETRAKVIHAGLGNVNVNDVNLAVASKALIVAFNVKTEADARRAAELQGVTIREYSVIYTLVEEIEQMLTGMLEPRFQEVVHGHTEVRQAIKAGRKVIAGCIVSDGVVHRRDRVRLRRGNQQLWEGTIASLRRFKDDVNEVREGFECGIALEGWDDIVEGDTMEMFSSERI